MHEMAIAEGILDIALDYAARNQAQQIQCISLLLGEMTGVETESLQFCFAALKKGTIAEQAELKLHRVPLMGHCPECGKKVHIKHYNFQCPECGSGQLAIISGRELQVEYLEVD
jgi:hydrogenase nickel incorporation protein HypA/HybF